LNPVGDDEVNRRQHNGTIIEVPSLRVVRSYNSNMGGIDLSDQLRGYYMSGRKSQKWWHCLPWFFEDTSIVNAYILEKLLRNNRHRTQISLGDFSARRLSVSSQQIEGDWPIP